MQGILVVDKPCGWTSRDVVNKVSKLLQTKKVGHTGTLDPLATGVLILCIGSYTKLVTHLVSHDKIYEATLRFGYCTDTLDITGEKIAECDKIPTAQEIEWVLSELKGELEMEVPIYSAKKVHGKKLYEYARNHESVELPKQDVMIYDLQMLSYTNKEVKIRCHVSSGTYIRSLLQEICQRLSCLGVMSGLRRIQVGACDITSAYTMEDLVQNRYVLKDFRSFFLYQVHECSDEEYQKVFHGNEISLSFSEDYVLLTYQGREISLYQRHDSLFKPLLFIDKKS